MRTTLFLKDEAVQPRVLLQNAASVEATARESKTVVGRNCDRWGHRCPARAEEMLPKAELGISVPIEK